MLSMDDRNVRCSIGSEVEYPVIGKLTCNSKNIIYIIECTKCKEYYVSETSNTLWHRLNSHLTDIPNGFNKPVANHFNDLNHTAEYDMVISPIEQILEQGSVDKNTIKR